MHALRSVLEVNIGSISPEVKLYVNKTLPIIQIVVIYKLGFAKRILDCFLILKISFRSEAQLD